MTQEKFIIKDRNLLTLVEKFMGCADGYLSEVITWNDIMPIVEKIRGLGYVTVDIYDKLCHIYHDNYDPQIDDGGFSVYGKSDNNKEAIWKAVVEFIKWFNENNV